MFQTDSTACWIESRWGRDFPHSSTPTLGPTRFPNTMGLKRQERGVNYPPPPNAEVKERVEQYLYPPFG